MTKGQAYPPVVVVDENDNEIGSAMLSDVWQKGLYHRIVSIFVQDDRGRMLLQLRGSNVKVYSGCWDQAAGGHVDEGFSYDEAAKQETTEELGLSDIKLEALGTVRSNTTFDDGRIINQFERVYIATVPHDVVLKPQLAEVSKLCWFTPSQLREKISQKPTEFTPGLLDCLQKYFPAFMPTDMHHPSGIKPSIVQKVFQRRGRLHAFPTLDPAKTALVVVDLDTGTVTRVDDEIRAFVPRINALATALRSHGGTVAWVTTPIHKATANFRAIYGDKLTAMYEAEGAKNGKATTLWHELDAKSEDVYATKLGASAFFPGKSDLHEQLRQKGIDTLLIVGAVTNVCCEASARDAAELEYKVTLVSDALWGHGNGLHEATLATFFRNYGDVRPSNEILDLITGLSLKPTTKQSHRQP